MRIPTLTIIKNHLTQNPQQHAVGSLRLPVTLWVIRCRPPVLDPVVLQHFSNIFVDKRSTIVADDLVGNAKSCDDVLSDEVGHGCSGGFAKWNGLDPFRKIFCGCQYPNISTGWRINRANEVQPPYKPYLIYVRRLDNIECYL